MLPFIPSISCQAFVTPAAGRLQCLGKIPGPLSSAWKKTQLRKTVSGGRDVEKNIKILDFCWEQVQAFFRSVGFSFCVVSKRLHPSRIVCPSPCKKN